ncbi:MAG: response regulator transcription factor [Agathobacter sp.]|nr:response regulator transcription factor [Agathobacter sp.]MDY3796914.1 response regulator transcription factor [Agathobacter sp.]
MSRILIIEDEIAINKMLCLNLGITGYETVSLYDGQEVLDWLGEDGAADLALLDVMLPKIDGFALLQPLLEHNIPVIFLTAKGDIESKLQGLTNGAEDYIVKPFEMLEVMARIELVLKRYGKNDNEFKIDDVEVNLDERTVRKNGEELTLTPIEFDLLVLLIRNKNVALTREKMLNEVWNIFYEGSTRTVDVHIAQLRKKTGLNIISVPKIGYRLEVN